MVYEIELYPTIENLLEKGGYQHYTEVKVLTRSVDIIAIKRNKVIAIEVKVENWKRALQQALTCRLFAHETYIAIWCDYSHRIPIKLLKKHRIGLIIVTSNKAKISLKAKTSNVIHKNVMQNVLDTI